MNMGGKRSNRSNKPSQKHRVWIQYEKEREIKKGACGSSLTKVLIISGILHTFPSAAQDERSTPLHHRPTLHTLLHQAGTVYTHRTEECHVLRLVWRYIEHYVGSTCLHPVYTELLVIWWRTYFRTRTCDHTAETARLLSCLSKPHTLRSGSRNRKVG